MFLAITGEAAVLALLLQRRVSRLLPVFTIYVSWTIMSDVVSSLLIHRFPAHYLQIYNVEMPLDSVLQFGVLVELAWSALRPARALLPRGSFVGVAAVILLAGAAIWPFAGITAISGLTSQWHLTMHLQQTFTILRIVFFLALAACSQLLAIGWRNRELQVATGLGFYSMVSLGALMIQAHQVSPLRYHAIDELVAVSYLFSLLYWVASFVRNEAPRREFSPRMQKFLLAIAGAAHADRLAMEQARKSVRH
ncbi:MAG: hypothetical protein ACLGSD_04720 [Acidobacteriota bacterium]